MLQVNIIALTELTRLVLPQMVARKRGNRQIRLRAGAADGVLFDRLASGGEKRLRYAWAE